MHISVKAFLILTQFVKKKHKGFDGSLVSFNIISSTTIFCSSFSFFIYKNNNSYKQKFGVSFLNSYFYLIHGYHMQNHIFQF
jgi:hypothetical protein